MKFPRRSRSYARKYNSRPLRNFEVLRKAQSALLAPPSSWIWPFLHDLSFSATLTNLELRAPRTPSSAAHSSEGHSARLKLRFLPARQLSISCSGCEYESVLRRQYPFTRRDGIMQSQAIPKEPRMHDIAAPPRQVNSHLAIEGGQPLRDTPFAPWPYFESDEVEAAAAVLRSGKVTTGPAKRAGSLRRNSPRTPACKHAIASRTDRRSGIGAVCAGYRCREMRSSPPAALSSLLPVAWPCAAPSQ